MKFYMKPIYVTIISVEENQHLTFKILEI